VRAAALSNAKGREEKVENFFAENPLVRYETFIFIFFRPGGKRETARIPGGHRARLKNLGKSVVMIAFREIFALVPRRGGRDDEMRKTKQP
jgi:hypothetical protein